MGRRLRRDVDATGARWLTPAQRPDRTRRRAPRVRAQPRRRIRRDHGERPARLATRRRRRSACPVALRSVTLSVPDLARSEEFFRHGLGLQRSAVALREPEHEALWRLAGARTRGTVLDAGASSSSWCSTSIRSGGRARRATRSRIRASSTSPSAPDSRRDHRELYDRATAAGARPNRRPLHTPGGGVVYVNDPDGFSVELLWMSQSDAPTLGIHATTGFRAATRGHARDRANSAHRRARAGHVGRDRRP